MNISLRALEPDDLDFLYDIENDIEHWDIVNTTMPYSRDFLQQYILTSTGDIYRDKQVRLIITCNDDTVGIVDLSSFDPKNQRAEVGIIVKKEWQNKDVATEALHLLYNYCRNVIHLHSLYAIIPEDNTVSLKLFQKCHFDITGKLKDWLYNGRSYRNAFILQKFT